jgi:hypothetical protein
MSNNPTETVSETLHSFETRLRRIEYLLAGTYEDPHGQLLALERLGHEHSVSTRLNALERDLGRLMAKSKTVKDIVSLRKYSHFLFSFTPPVCSGQQERERMNANG